MEDPFTDDDTLTVRVTAAPEVEFKPINPSVSDVRGDTLPVYNHYINDEGSEDEVGICGEGVMVVSLGGRIQSCTPTLRRG